jgi:hypothetical protein
MPPISERGNVIETAKLFGGPEKTKYAAELRVPLYAGYSACSILIRL